MKNDDFNIAEPIFPQNHVEESKSQYEEIDISYSEEDYNIAE